MDAMPRLSGDFHTDLSPPDTLVACAEAVDGIGWHVVSVDNRRIVSYADTDGPSPPMIELRLAKLADGTDIRIIGSGTDTHADGELIAQLERVREAIGARIAATPGPEQSAVAARRRNGATTPSPAPNRLRRRTALGLAALVLAGGLAIAAQLIPGSNGKHHAKRAAVNVRPSTAKSSHSRASGLPSSGHYLGAGTTAGTQGSGGSTPAPAQGPLAQSSPSGGTDGQKCGHGLGPACGIVKCHRLHCPPPHPQAPPSSDVADWSVGWGTYTSSGRVWPGANWRPYAGPSGGPQGVSAFNRRVPPNPPIASSEDGYARQLETSFAGFSGGGGSPVFFAVPADPNVTINAPGSPDGVNGKVIDVPRNAQSEGSWDSHISILSSSSGTVTECWLAHLDWGHNPPQLDANNCDQEPINGDGMLTPYAVTAGGISKIAGEVWPSEFSAGRIQHALVLNVPCVTGHAYPVTVSNDTNCNGPWLGGRVWLDLSQAQINAIPSRNARILAQALHDYGGYIRDSGNGGGWEIGGVSGSSWTLMGAADPWSGFQDVSGSAIPWSGHLHILDACTAQGTC
jgi:hypothetical protein